MESETKGRWGQALRYTFGALLLLLAVGNLWVGSPWYISVVILGAAATFILGGRRILRPGITVMADEIVCRYIPWYEGNSYFLNVLLPIMGVGMIAAGNDPGNPTWLRFTGILLLAPMPLFIHSTIRIWRRSVLRISPSALTVRLAPPGSGLTEIPREQVKSITPMIVTNGVGGRSLQVEVAYYPADSDNNAAETVLLGLHLTVKPVNLANALIAWDDAAIDDPDELLDLIERILRSKAVPDVTPPPSRSALDADRDVPGDGSDHE